MAANALQARAQTPPFVLLGGRAPQAVASIFVDFAPQHVHVISVRMTRVQNMLAFVAAVPAFRMSRFLKGYLVCSGGSSSGLSAARWPLGRAR